MIVFPKAKINLGLRITGKRPDGYHDIETIFYPVNLCDALEFVKTVEPAGKDLLTVTGISTGNNPEENLVIKTLRKLREKYSFPFLRIHLHKTIPTGAGLGGGSSDASYILKAVNRCFGPFTEDEELKAIALELGSDCPFFIDAVPSFATGRGEILKSVKPVLTGYYLLIVNPGIGINTKEAYSNCRPEHPLNSLMEIIDRPVAEWKNLIINDFEDFVFAKYPLIGKLKSGLYNSGALFSSMSGSGSSVYGVFQEKPIIPANLKDFVIWEGTL